MNKYTRWLLRLIGPLILAYFLLTSNLGEIIAILGKLTPAPLLLSLALYPVFVIVKAWRWSMIMRELRLQVPSLGLTAVLYMIGLFLGGATPGQSGDFIKAWYLRERGQPLAPALFSILLDRLFDFLIMALLSLLGLIAFLDVLPRPLRLAAITFATVIILLTPTLIARRPRDWLMTRTLPLAPLRVRALIERWRDQFAGLNLRPALLAKLMLASICSAGSTVVRIYLLFLALNLSNVPILAVVSSTALIAILGALPISVAGVGVRDAILIPVLALYHYTPEQALSLSALFLLLNVEQIIAGFLVSLRHPLGRAAPADALAQTEQVERLRG